MSVCPHTEAVSSSQRHMSAIQPVIFGCNRNCNFAITSRMSVNVSYSVILLR